jgi:predicted CopG family antitoxin
MYNNVVKCKSMKKEYCSIKISKETYEKLRDLKHPGQSLDGVIQELMLKKTRITGVSI